MFEGHPAQILIVDDNALNRKKLRLAVETIGYDAQAASSGQEALDLLRSKPCDAVLLDLLMPEMDGFEVMSCMKTDGALKELPIIVISDLEGEPESVSRAIELGAEDFLPKGFDPLILTARLRASLRKKEFRDQELQYFRRIDVLTHAAERVEAGDFEGSHLNALAAEAQERDPIGRLAGVFRGMAKEIHAREVRLLDRIRLLQGALLLILCGSAIGVAPSLSRLAAGLGARPLGLVMWVDVFAALLCLSVALFRGPMPRLSRADWGFFAIWAFIVGILQHGTVFLFAGHVEATYLTMLLALQTLLVFAFASLMRLERASPQRILGLCVGLLGIALALFDRMEGSGSAANFWLIAALVVPLVYAIEPLIVAAKRPQQVDIVLGVGLLFAISVLFALPLSVAFGQFMAPALLMAPLGGIVLALALVTVLVNVSFVYLLDLAGPIFASQVTYVSALSGIVWGMLLLGERLTLIAWGAMGLVLIGIFLVETKRSGKPIKIQRNYRL